jgi:hypothetical protein
MAQIGWIDFSSKDRHRAQQLLSLIRPEGQLDELGVGYIRDGLANNLFPGISTIQTRAKYFFIVPNIIRDFSLLHPTERRRTSAKNYLNEKEHWVKNNFRELYNSQEGLGIIGVTLNSKKYIKTNPSEIYWVGMQVHGFMNPSGLRQPQYLRNLSNQQPLQLLKTDEEADDVNSNYEEVSPIYTPVDIDWQSRLQLELTPDEADFFSTQIKESTARYPHSLLPQLLANKILMQTFIESANFQNFVIASFEMDLPKDVRKLLNYAFDFSLVMEGVHILYNHLLQMHYWNENYSGSFEIEWQNWRMDLDKKMIDFNGFNTNELFVYIRTNRPNSEHFVTAWWQLIQKSNPIEKPSHAMLALVKQREQISKGKKSRLSKPVSANVDIELNKRIGLSLFQYRFFNAKTIVSDIINPKLPDAASK